jgi:hypothetical protein
MPSNKWILIGIGIALGVFVIPIVMGYISGIGGASTAPNSARGV